MTAPRDLINRSTCAALVLTCSDFRFKSAELAFIQRCGLTDDYDLIARPGAARSLVAPRTAAAGETLRDEIALLWSVHHFPRILLVNHVSCRAYDDIATPRNERDVHAEHLRAATDALSRAYTGVTVEPYLVVADAAGMAVKPIAVT